MVPIAKMTTGIGWKTGVSPQFSEDTLFSGWEGEESRRTTGKVDEGYIPHPLTSGWGPGFYSVESRLPVRGVEGWGSRSDWGLGPGGT